MKKAIIYSALSALLLCSCADLGYNEVSPRDEQWIYDNPTTGVKNMVFDVYALMFNEFKTNYDGALMCSATDEADYALSLSDIHKYYNGGWSAANPFPETWQRSYLALAEIHTFLEKIEKINLDDYKYDSKY